MDAAVAEPPNSTAGYAGRTIEERVSLLEGKVTNQDRIFDMLSEGKQDIRGDITGLRTETRTGLRELRDDMDTRFGEVDARIAAMGLGVNKCVTVPELRVNECIAAMETHLIAKLDSSLKWMVGVQIAMWVTIIAAVLL